MQEFLNRVIHGECSEVMQYMPSGSVDLTVTSPPYDNLRKYNGFEWDFERIARELYRVTKDGGVVVWVVGDATVDGSETGTSFRQALYFKELGFRLYDTMIYAKENPIPLSHRRYEQQFEFMFVLSKGKPNTFNGLMRSNKHAGKTESGTFRHDGDKLTNRNTQGKTRNKSLRRNIWSYSVGKGSTTNDGYAYKHPAMFPEKLAEDHILSWSNPGDVVFDPMCGSGTTLKMAYLNNRNFIGIDYSVEYVELSRKRLKLAESK